jgi:hypothetical protein
LVEIAVGIGPSISANREGLVLYDGVFMSIYGWVDSDAEDVLVVLCEGSWVDNVAPGAGLAWVDVDDGDDAGGSCFDGYGTSLIKFVLVMFRFSVNDIFQIQVGKCSDNLR